MTSATGKVTFSDFLNLFVLSEKYDLGIADQGAADARPVPEPGRAEPGRRKRQGSQFLAGGEFPIPVAQGSGANIGDQRPVQGVRRPPRASRRSSTATACTSRSRPEVSTLDFANAVVLNGFRIPALSTRRTATELELRDGQTFAIAGLMNNTMNSTLQKIPGIGDIPILGYLFRSKAAQKNQHRAGGHDHAADPPRGFAGRDQRAAEDGGAVPARRSTDEEDDCAAAAGVRRDAWRASSAPLRGRPQGGAPSTVRRVLRRPRRAALPVVSL